MAADRWKAVPAHPKSDIGFLRFWVTEAGEAFFFQAMPPKSGRSHRAALCQYSAPHVPVRGSIQSCGNGRGNQLRIFRICIIICIEIRDTSPREHKFDRTILLDIGRCADHLHRRNTAPPCRLGWSIFPRLAADGRDSLSQTIKAPENRFYGKQKFTLSEHLRQTP